MNKRKRAVVDARLQDFWWFTILYRQEGRESKYIHAVEAEVEEQNFDPIVAKAASRFLTEIQQDERRKGRP